jgi:hypothetical protein
MVNIELSHGLYALSFTFCAKMQGLIENGARSQLKPTVKYNCRKQNTYRTKQLKTLSILVLLRGLSLSDRELIPCRTVGLTNNSVKTDCQVQLSKTEYLSNKATKNVINFSPLKRTFAIRQGIDFLSDYRTYQQFG